MKKVNVHVHHVLETLNSVVVIISYIYEVINIYKHIPRESKLAFLIAVLTK